MNHRTRDIMIGLSLVMNILLAASLLYDYTQNDSRLTLVFLGAYFVYSLVFLFMWAMSRREEAAVDALTTYVLDNGHILDGHSKVTPAPATPPVAPVVAAPPAAPKVVPAAAPTDGPFTFNGYLLHSQTVTLKNGGARLVYFFSKRKPAAGSPCAKPAGFHVGVNERTGLPFLKRGTGPDGEDLTPHVEAAYRPQCTATTADDLQCRNSARHASKYCSSHFGYQPKVVAQAQARREDTLPHVKGARDTMPAVRRSA